MKKIYISPKLSFESIEEDTGILIDGSHTELKDFKGGKTSGTFSEDPVNIYGDVLTTSSGPAPRDADWDDDE